MEFGTNCRFFGIWEELSLFWDLGRIVAFWNLGRIVALRADEVVLAFDTFARVWFLLEGVGLIVAGGGGDDLVAVLVDGAGGCGGQLALLLGLLLDLGYLLSLGRGRADLHAQDDVPDLTLCQRGHVHTVNTPHSY